jgi:hypothetical protein
MNSQPLYAESPAQRSTTPSRRQHATAEQLILSELNPLAVIDQAAEDEEPISLMSFGSVREACPKCQHTQLRLILRQESVRTPHLFCAECESCFDAHYASGVSALSI